MKKLILLIASSVMLFASVGEMLAVKGDVKIVRDNKEVVAKNGMAVEEKDVITTSNRAKAQIMFKDETVIRIGKSTTFKIEDYKFDGSANSKANLKVSKGFFKAITGKIGKVARDNFKLKTKTATCGIRGTHFMGLVGDTEEKIACTKGAITVEAKGRSVDVLAGEITSFKSGLAPSTPTKFKAGDLKGLEGGFKVSAALSKKIQSVKLGKDMKISQEQLDEVLSEISEIKDNDLKIAALDELEASLNAQYDALLGAENAIDVTNSFNSGNKDMRWGFYANGDRLTFDEIVALDGQALSNALTLDEYGNIEVWRNSMKGETSPEIIAEKMGFDVGNMSVFDSWDGKADSKKVATYEGKYLGSVFYRDSHQIVDTKNNSVKFTLDFGNRYLVGNINFDVKKPDGTTQTWNVDMASIGSYTINPTSFYVDNFGFWGNDGFAGADTFFNRFFGSDAEQISAYFQGLINTDPELRDEYDQIAYGAFVANKTDEVTLTKQELGSDEYFSYGLWAKDDLSMDEVLNTMAMGAWVNSKEAVTSADIINEYITNGAKASYSGEVYGTVHSPISGADTEMMKNGNIALNFDFAKANVDGKIGFEAGSQAWNMNVHDGLVNGDGFAFGGFDGTVGTSGEVVDFLEGNGKFYGSNAERIGGGFQAGTTGGKFAIGAFKAGQ